MKHVLPQLSYQYDALEPYIDAKTMEIHYSKHHQAYVDNLNAALEKAPEFAETPLVNLLTGLDKLPEAIRAAVRNNGGGHLNHTFFWETLAAAGDSIKPHAEKRAVVEAIVKSFGSFENFQKEFKDAGLKRFGSGWAWLVLDNAGSLHISSSPNQDSPIMEGLVPLLGFDVWEHAYYLKYNNRRGDYVDALWNVVDWNVVEKRYQIRKG